MLSAFNTVCGTVTPSEPRNVLIQAETSSLVQSVAISNDGKGKWCTYLPMGVYNINVEVSDKEQKDGLQFYPLSERVTVSSAPVEGVMFSQLYCEVQGKVQCAVPQCRNLAVTLKSLANGNGKELVTRTKEDGTYSFSNVLPGTVQLSVSEDALCWRDAALTVRVAAAAARAPPFVHSGYRVTVRAKYDATTHPTSSSMNTGQTRLLLRPADAALHYTVMRKGVLLMGARGLTGTLVRGDWERGDRAVEATGQALEVIHNYCLYPTILIIKM
ncbi:hypothetical protein JYU34_003930 [Plutella xylostella]|uniref:NOMO fifth transthyretin-like domain-containing protein n=1 Tax=Plutella xylostella TaxID=51655 RepID=A0ABQ7R1B8_PLUXY|nr:hypothetical protein JYU34_003930 [Plutella xylostella]